MNYDEIIESTDRFASAVAALFVQLFQQCACNRLRVVSAVAD